MWKSPPTKLVRLWNANDNCLLLRVPHAHLHGTPHRLSVSYNLSSGVEELVSPYDDMSVTTNKTTAEERKKKEKSRIKSSIFYPAKAFIHERMRLRAMTDVCLKEAPVWPLTAVNARQKLQLFQKSCVDLHFSYCFFNPHPAVCITLNNQKVISSLSCTEH